MPSLLRAAAIQIRSLAQINDNLERLAALVERAVQQGAELVVLPENFAFVGPEASRLDIAEALPPLGSAQGSGPLTKWLSALAKLHSIHLVGAGMPERGPDDAHTYNTSVYYGPDGTLKQRYRKIHLFDVALADGTALQESSSVAAGSDVVSAHTPWGTMGMSICYDVRFPELFRALSHQGMQLLTIGAAFTLHTGRDHWLTLLKARAIENQCYVVAAAQWGRHDDKRVTFGRSVIIDPWGIELAIAPDRDGFALAEIDFTAQDKIRRELPALTHRKL